MLNVVSIYGGQPFERPRAHTICMLSIITISGIKHLKLNNLFIFFIFLKTTACINYNTLYTILEFLNERERSS